jgi:protein-tyrosine phosphatase
MAGEAGMNGPVRLLGAPNFRDVGGLRTRDGRIVAPGRLLRSGQLGELHRDDILALERWLGTDVCVIDLRGAAERAKRACSLPRATVHSLPIEPSVAHKLDALIAAGEPRLAHVTSGLMAEAYRNFARNARGHVATLFEHALARGGRPLLVHCTAGKDRTGFMIAMLLSALDVPREAILEDYLATNQRMAVRESERYPREVMEVLGTVRPDFLHAAFNTIDTEFGGCDAYLQKAATLTAERRALLQQHLLLSP